VDDFSKFGGALATGEAISEILTIRHLKDSLTNSAFVWTSRRIHRFTAVITTTSLTSFFDSKKFCRADYVCGLLLCCVLIFLGQWHWEEAPFHLFPQRSSAK
jgi:hypothetical protein